jgi:hypothetical protein
MRDLLVRLSAFVARNREVFRVVLCRTIGPMGLPSKSEIGFSSGPMFGKN